MRTTSWSGPVRVAAAGLLAAGSWAVGPGAAGAGSQPLSVLGVLPAGGSEVAVVVTAPPGSPAPSTVTAFDGEVHLPSRVEPLVSDRSAVALVVDASQEADAALRGGGRAGLAAFLLGLPSGTGSALIADRDPATVLSAATVGVADDVRVTTTLAGTGQRDTAAAVALALDQLSGSPGPGKVLVLFTAAPAAGEQVASVLGEQLAEAGVVLGVVHAGPEESGDGRQWQAVAARTGGVALTVGGAGELAAFDAVADELRRRALVVLERPADGASRVTLRTGGGGTVSVDLPPTLAAGEADPQAGVQDGRAWVAPVLALVAAAALLAGWLRWRQRPRAPLGSEPGPSPTRTARPLPVPTAAPPAEPAAEPRSPAQTPIPDLEDAVRAEPHVPEHRQALAMAHRRQADADRAGGRVALAASGYRQAVDILAGRVRLAPDVAAYRHDLAVAMAELAALDEEQGWIAQAMAGYRQAIEIAQRLVEEEPGNGRYRRDLDAARTRLHSLRRAHPS